MCSVDYIWAKVLGHLESVLGSVTVQTWFDDAQVLELSDDRLLLCSPVDFHRQMIRTKCAAHILQALHLQGYDVTVEVCAPADHPNRTSGCHVCRNPQFSFDSYVAGTSNQIALQLCQAVAEQPGAECRNPLMLYGPSGVGKTHLLYAIANAVSRLHPELKVVCIKAEQFTNELIQAIMSGKNDAFPDKYRDADVFLMDDIHFIAGKESTQEEFFHTFNALFEKNKQIVVTADRKPCEILTLQERLRSRFGKGTIIGIQPPDYPTRLEITRKKADAMGLPLDDGCIAYIAESLTENVRRIEGALKKLLACRDLAHAEVSIRTVKPIVDEIRTEYEAEAASPELVLHHVCDYFGVTQQDLFSGQKTRNIVVPRQVAIYLLRFLTKMQLMDIARMFCRDHTTVLYTIRKTENAMKDPEHPMYAVVTDIMANIAASC